MAKWDPAASVLRADTLYAYPCRMMFSVPGHYFLVRPLLRQRTFPFCAVSNCASTGAAWSPLHSWNTVSHLWFHSFFRHHLCDSLHKSPPRGSRLTWQEFFWSLSPSLATLFIPQYFLFPSRSVEKKYAKGSALPAWKFHNKINLIKVNLKTLTFEIHFTATRASEAISTEWIKFHVCYGYFTKWQTWINQHS